MKIIQKKSFGSGINPSGKNVYIWVDKGREIDALLTLFSDGWLDASFIFEDCEIIQ